VDILAKVVDPVQLVSNQKSRQLLGHLKMRLSEPLI
jgi:hypothetical protein